MTPKEKNAIQRTTDDTEDTDKTNLLAWIVFGFGAYVHESTNIRDLRVIRGSFRRDPFRVSH